MIIEIIYLTIGWPFCFAKQRTLGAQYQMSSWPVLWCATNVFPNESVKWGFTWASFICLRWRLPGGGVKVWHHSAAYKRREWTPLSLTLHADNKHAGPKRARSVVLCSPPRNTETLHLTRWGSCCFGLFSSFRLMVECFLVGVSRCVPDFVQIPWGLRDKVMMLS